MLADFFAALALIKEILNLVTGVVAFVRESKNEKWFQDSAAAFANFKQSTPEERKELAKKISDLLGGM